ncbi:MAG TPA: NrpR regulatory domain-containing protein [bacterium]|nr:NrpR regulatory domain-containing protein [bacterium]
MVEISQTQKIAILRVLRDAREPIGSSIIAEEIKDYGFELSGRTIRLYLQELENQGFVTSAKRGRDGGRTITQLGYEEIRNALVNERVGFMASRIEALACQVTFNPATREGHIVLNVTLLDQTHLAAAVREMLPVFEAGLGMGHYAVLIEGGERLGGFYIPPGKVGIGTICSVTVNGILLGARVPVASRFGGVLEINQGKPFRFTDVIYYNGTTLDPLEIFIKGGLTRVSAAARQGQGRIGASFREVPNVSLPVVERIQAELEPTGMGRGIFLGKPHQPLLDFQVEEGKTGMIVTGGLNPVAAIEEAGIPTLSYALSTLYEFEKMTHYQELFRMTARHTA